MTENVHTPDEDTPVSERETSGEGIELTMTDEPTTFEPEEDPEAVDEPAADPESLDEPKNPT